ncbi:MAG TPA: molybdopterin cofactor-binding domain-containing protein, partial [Thermoanaerobaculia bacterium]
MSRTPTRVVGRPYAKVDAAAKVTGQTKFADDVVLPRMLHCKLLRSKIAHARILSVDVAKALAAPGVVAIATGDDLPTPFGILPVSQDEHALCRERVRYVGDPVAAIAAISEDAAFDALDLVEVRYAPLPPIATIDEGLAPAATPIHDYGDQANIHKLVSMEFGSTAEGFARADRIYDNLYFYEGNTHLALEQHAAVADFGPDGKLTLWSSTQTPHYVHRALAKVLAMPAARIRVIATPNGGGFGGKSDVFNHEIVVSHLSRVTGRPVKICLTREEVFYCHRGRHPTLMRVKTGVKNDGAITALHFQTVLDGGGYGSYGVASTYYTGALQTVTYQVPAYRFDGARVFTNKPPCGPKRGHGTPQPRFALEAELDRIACDLGLDPAAIRRDHLQPPNSLTANFLRVGSIGLGACIDRVVAASGWKRRRGKLPHGRGLGLACGSYLSGAGLPIYWNTMPQSGVQLKIDRGGGVTVFCGSTEIGQGSDTILAAIVAEVLGIDPFDIRVVTGDTDLTPVDLGSYSSRVTLMTGNAAIQAAERARQLLVAAAAGKLEIPAERVGLADGRVFDVENPEKGLTFPEAAVAAETKFGTLGTVGSYKPPQSAAKYKGGGVGPSPTYSFSAAVVELEVDPDTGIIHLEKVWMAHDVGRSLNPMLVIGQVEGSVYMGLGEALMEEQEFRLGVHKTPSMLDYKSPTSMDICPVE